MDDKRKLKQELSKVKVALDDLYSLFDEAIDAIDTVQTIEEKVKQQEQERKSKNA